VEPCELLPVDPEYDELPEDFLAELPDDLLEELVDAEERRDDDVPEDAEERLDDEELFDVD
jgi:hypothetical protein